MRKDLGGREHNERLVRDTGSMNAKLSLSSRSLSFWSLAAIAIAALVMFTACSASTSTEVATEPVAQTPTTSSIEPSALPATDPVEPTAAPATDPVEPTAAPAADPTAVPATPAGPPCADVPSFRSADTVSIACEGSYAVSPELFASNAGWHLFEAQADQWVEIDYARTCCEFGDERFVDMLIRNGLSPATATQLCADAGLSTDPSTGCVAGEGEPADFEPTWLRVNGFGDHDFGADQDVVIRSLDSIFEFPLDVSENGECGAGPMTIASFPDFTVQFQNNELIGWYYTSSTPELTTPSGVAVGISEAALVEAYQGLEIFDGSLGREFSFTVPAGSIGGFIDGVGGPVVALFAGTNCFFR